MMEWMNRAVQSNQKLHYYHNIILLVCYLINYDRKLSFSSINLNTDPLFLLYSVATLRNDIWDNSPI